MRLVDLSHDLSATTPVYPSDPVFSCTAALTHDEDGCAVSRLSMGSHTGTHLDAPLHFVRDGKAVNEVELDVLVGPVIVIDVSFKKPQEAITPEDISGPLLTVETMQPSPRILLLRTDWSQYWNNQDKYSKHPYVAQETAQAIVNAGIRVLGVDSFSPDPVDSHDFPTHHTLLGAGCLIVENLNNLRELSIAPESWKVSLVPLKLVDCDGSPIRAYAWNDV